MTHIYFVAFQGQIESKQEEQASYFRLTGLKGMIETSGREDRNTYFAWDLEEEMKKKVRKMKIYYSFSKQSDRHQNMILANMRDEYSSR